MINIPVPPWRRDFDCARDPYTARNALGITSTGGGGAPTGAEYITGSADATLTNERVLTNSATITWDLTTPGQVKANTAAGGGNVSNSGTPTSAQYARWVTATTIQGVAPATVLSDIGAQPAGNYQPLDATLTALAAFNTNGLLTQTAADTFTGRTLTGPAAGITVSNGDGVAGNPTLALANDLSALEALSGTNTIYYRSGTDAWSSVTIGAGLAFASGTLSATASAPTEPYGHGYLSYVSATALLFAPYNGNKIKINGTLYTIPAAGIAGLANTSVFVNGTGGQNLAASTVYWVFAFSNSGTVTADFRTAATHTASTTAGNEGVEILTGNDTRTLIGLIRTNASSQFQDDPSNRYVASWFNRRPKIMRGSNTSTTTTSTTAVELAAGARVNFVTFTETGHLAIGFNGYTVATVSQCIITSIIWLDGSAITMNNVVNNAALNCQINASTFAAVPASEGFHYLTIAGSVNTATGQFQLALAGTILQ